MSLCIVFSIAVQLIVACILGIGLVKLGPKNIFRKTEVRKFFFMWLISPAVVSGLAFLLTWLADKIGYLG